MATNNQFHMAQIQALWQPTKTTRGGPELQTRQVVHPYSGD